MAGPGHYRTAPCPALSTLPTARAPSCPSTATPPDWPSRSSSRGRTVGTSRRPSMHPTRPVRWPRPTAAVPIGRSCSCSTCSPTHRAAACTSGTRWATSAPTSTPASSGCAGTTCSTRWASTPSACRPSSGRSRPASTPGSPPRPTSPTSAASCDGSGWATTGGARCRPPTSTTTAGRSGSSCRSSTAGTTPSGARPGPSPSSRPPSRKGRDPPPTAGPGRHSTEPSSCGCSTTTAWPTSRTRR